MSEIVPESNRYGHKGARIVNEIKNEARSVFQMIFIRDINS